MPTETDFAWLAGVIDGEGSIALTWAGGNKIPALKMIIYSNPGPLMDKVRRILDEAGVPHSHSFDSRTGHSSGRVSVSSYACVTLYPLIATYLVRQISRYRAGVEFLAPRYNDPARTVNFRNPVWNDAARLEWRTIRAAHGLTDSEVA